MTVLQTPLEIKSFNGYEDLKDSLLYGLRPEEMVSKTVELVRTSLYVKAASYRKAENQEIINIPKQWFWPETHQFLESIIESQEKNLIYEWSQITKSKSGCLPANILCQLLEWARKDLELANFVLPVLGDSGKALVDLIPEWKLFSMNAWKNPLQFEKSESRIFAFSQFRKYASELAFNYFIEHHNQIKEAEKLKWMRILKSHLIESEIEQLIKIFDSSKFAIQFELVFLSLCLSESNFFEQCKSKFLDSLNSNALDHFQFISFGKKEYTWTNAQKIKAIPLSYLNEKTDALKYMKWIEEQGAEEDLLEAIRTNPSQTFLSTYFQDLLQNKKLTEEYPTALLSAGFDHAGFNNACIQWIEKEGTEIDLEAFLHIINSEKHFWSDELLTKILELRNHKALDRKYDFGIFWQLLPYKMNPNSVHVKSIPAECRIFINTLLHFESIIQFRKWIRTQNTD